MVSIVVFEMYILPVSAVISGVARRRNYRLQAGRGRFSRVRGSLKDTNFSLFYSVAFLAPSAAAARKNTCAMRDLM